MSMLPATFMDLNAAGRTFLEGRIAANRKSFGNATMMAFATDADDEHGEAPSPETPPAEKPVNEPAEVTPEDTVPKPEDNPDAPADNAVVEVTPEAVEKENDGDFTPEELAELERQEDPPLGEAGQRAYERKKAEVVEVKKERDDALKQVQDLQAEIDDLKASRGDTAASDAASAESRELSTLRREVGLSRAKEEASKLKVPNAELAIRLLGDVKFKDGKVDTKWLTESLDDLAAEYPTVFGTKPEPKPAPTPVTEGTAGRGNKNSSDADKTRQLTDAEVEALDEDGLAEARRNRQLDRYFGIVRS